jgi:putative addiction module component (TIGR02574 family)
MPSVSTAGGGRGEAARRRAGAGWYPCRIMGVRVALIEEVLTLPEPEREALLRALLHSLDEPGQDPDHAAAWDAEIARRVRDDEEDRDVFLDGPEAIAEIRAELFRR